MDIVRVRGEVALIPTDLYHYTNVDSLILILKTKKLRFTPLSQLDDLTEAMTEDDVSYADYCLVSSWTSQDQESIPMWKMYSDVAKGVRIKMPAPPFDQSALDDISSNSDYAKFFATPSDLLTKVNYTNEPQKLYPKLISANRVCVADLGKHKLEVWGFQEEWRYRYALIPYALITDHKGGGFRLKKPTEHIPPLLDSMRYLQLTGGAFEALTITLSPQISPAAEEIVRLAVSKYAPKANIEESSLRVTLGK